MTGSSRFEAIDRAIYRLERRLVGALLFAMAAFVFLDVVHRIFSRSPGRISILLSGFFGTTAEALDERFSPALILLFVLGVAVAAVRSRTTANGGSPMPIGRSLILGAVATALLGAFVQGFVFFLPEGIVWAPYLSLSLLLWVGLIGASMATYSVRHLALEMGEKLWPERFQPTVKTISQLAAGTFSLLLAILGAMSLVDHLELWLDTPQASLIPSIDLPKWLVFSVVPYAFGMIAIRFIGRATGLIPTPPPASEHDVPLAPVAEEPS
jgi:TRAP-type C4-dicarboxylate transport system permease small subunit